MTVRKMLENHADIKKIDRDVYIYTFLKLLEGLDTNEETENFLNSKATGYNEQLVCKFFFLV